MILFEIIFQLSKVVLFSCGAFRNVVAYALKDLATIQKAYVS